MIDRTSSLQRQLANLQMTYGIVIPGAQVAITDMALVTEATYRAAVSGPFDLYRITAFVDKDDRPGVRQSLAAFSDPAPGAARRLRWLNADRRRASLAELMQHPAGLPSLLGRVRYDRTDAEGPALRALLRGWRPDLRRLSEPKLAAIITALGWMEGLTLPAGMAPLPDARAARTERTRRDRQRSRTALVAAGFVGRTEAMEAIGSLLDDPTMAGRILVISGPGGIGKSAILAHAARTFADRIPPVPVFSFDFDRPSLDPTGPGITLDLTRQLAIFLPDKAEELSRIRSVLRETFQRSGGESHISQSGFEASMRSSSEAAYILRGVVENAGLAQTPVLIVFDTLEVVAAQGTTALMAVREWVSFAQHEIGLTGIRAIVAGRAAEAAAEILGALHTYVVPPLNMDEGEQLLTLMGVDAKRAKDAAQIVDGTPLALRLGGRYLAEHPDAPVSVLAEGGAGDATLTQGIIYKRILNHVGTGADDPLRKLAYPGLALRLVTPGLIRDVIAPAVGIRFKHPDDAKALWRRLVDDHVWLVERETEGLARHRSDLRQDMLPLMRRDAAVAPVVERLHQLAVAYFRAGTDPDLPPGRARLEAVYHALNLLKPGEDLPDEDRRLVKAALVGEFFDLPPHAAALAMRHAGLLEDGMDVHGTAGDPDDISFALLRRIVDRIPEPALRKLVFPGFVLRLVTPALLRDALAPALGIPVETPQLLQTLWVSLANLTWLVERETDGLLRPRSELRLQILQMVRHDPAKAAELARLQTLSLAHFRADADPDLPSDRARLESVYLALMLLEPGAELAAEDRSFVPSAMAGDLSELPPHAAALARVYAGDPPQPEDVAVLPAVYRDGVIALLGWEAVDGDRPLDALALSPDAAEPWVWRLMAWLNAAEWHSDATARGLRTLGQAGPDGLARWYPEQKARLAALHQSTVALREDPVLADAAGAWLRLVRAVPDNGVVPPSATPPSYPSIPATSGDPSLRAARRRHQAACALSLLMRNDLTDQRWPLGDAALQNDGFADPLSNPDPLLADEIARAHLLNWASGKIGKNILPFTPAMIVATPAKLRRFLTLLANYPDAAARMEAVIASYPPSPSTAQLTGTIANTVARILTESGSASADRLAEAGFAAHSFLHGLMPEFRPGGRFLLRRLILEPGGLDALAQRLPDVLRLAGDPFLPADLATDLWREAAGRSDGIRAVSALVDWAGRIGRLDSVLAAAAGITADADLGVRMGRFVQVLQRIDHAVGRPPVA